MFKNDPLVKKALSQRNDRIAPFWLSEPNIRNKINPVMAGKKVLIIDAEDTFTAMFAQKLRAIDLCVTVRRYDTSSLLDGNWDLFIMGPGPGNPLDVSHPKIRRMKKMLAFLTSNSLPFLAICLSHQILCTELGLMIERKSPPNQGRQQKINIFGVSEYVGFYNTYVAKCGPQMLENLQNENIDVSLDASSEEVHALKGAAFYSVQFHPESLFTLRGIDIITSSINEVMKI